MPGFKAVLFDLDGTLLDTLADIASCVNLVRAELGLPPHPKEAYKHFVGDGLTELLVRAFPSRALRGPGLRARARRFEELYEQHSMDETRPYPGVARMLAGVARRGLPMAVVSNKPQRFTEECVAELLPRWRFAVVRGARPKVPLKPAPAGPLAAARAMGVRPGAVLYLGDTCVDMKAAVAAGMFPVGALWGFRDAEELERFGARVLIRRPGELLALL
ncbi:MAG: HAD hydrolase-like protein [Elusimicrobia bacterium]|nr:HAD hydrolase-like protein [Elusimicrobiota bacterium]